MQKTKSTGRKRKKENSEILTSWAVFDEAGNLVAVVKDKAQLIEAGVEELI